MSQEVIERIKNRSKGESEYHQAIDEVYLNVEAIIEQNPQYQELNIFERISEPERTIMFRVPWMDDQGNINVNRGYRVQMNSAIGPYKGGLRFHPSVTLSVLKFLAFEQVFKNALTGLPMGGGKGGSDFDPKGKSDAEVMRFTQSFMQELAKHIGHRTDVPAGDIGVGGREIGYLFGMYKKIKNEFVGVLTGKGQGWGGSRIRPEATGYGLIYFAMNMLEANNDTLKGKKCIVSGSGNVAQFAMEKIIENGGVPLTASDSSGYIYDKDGIDTDKLAFIMDLKNNRRGRIKEYADQYPSAEFHASDRSADSNPIWDIAADCAFPCATQNELNAKDAHNLVKNGVKLLAEGANMPTTPDAIEVAIENGIMYAPGKASNAGGVATSGLEMSQNYAGVYWTSEEVDSKLKEIMRNIHDLCIETADKYGHKGNYMAGANIAGFIKVADAMVAEGIL
ncbi:MAG: NADP-specific glutamate dehydrogenase [Cyclobacteriaceae bacterium]|nr:NADP-specific glutamate dehydrogenase [Cyclobacteriaceae bacterium]